MFLPMWVFIEALLRLSAAYAIVISSFDKLFFYALLVALSAIIVRLYTAVIVLSILRNANTVLA